MFTLILLMGIGVTIGVLAAKMMLEAGQASDASSAPKEAPSASDGFMSGGGIKTLLLSGAALLVWSAYLFVRSYWAAIPDAAKFAGLCALGVAAHGAGLSLFRREKVPYTARTLLGVGMVMIPFIAFSFRVWVAPESCSALTAWAVGLGAMALLAVGTARVAPSWEAGYLTVGGFVGAVGLGALSASHDGSFTLAAAAAALALAAFAPSLLGDEEDGAPRGARHAVVTAWFAVLATLAAQRFYWSADSQLFAAVALGLLGLSAALSARWGGDAMAVPAAVGFSGAGVLALRHIDLPLYQYGYVFGPMGLISLWRAWTWERAGRTALAKPLFWFGHLCLAASVLAVTPAFLRPGEAALFPLLGVLGLVSAAYAAGGALHRAPFYAYASGAVFLLLTGAVTRQTGAAFADGILFFSLAAGVLSAAGLIGGLDDEAVGAPLSALGLGTLTVALGLLGGRWGQELLQHGRVAMLMPPDQVDAGLWTGALSLAVYLFLALARRRAAYMYPALYSATWVYVCALQRMGAPLTLLSVAWVVAGAMGLHFILEAAGERDLGRGARLWGEVAFFVVGWAAAWSGAPEGVTAVALCAVSFLPGVWWGRSDVSLSFIGALGLIHFLYFRQAYPVMDRSAWALYALHGVAVTCGMVLLRTVLTYARPAANVMPFRVAALLYAVFGLRMSLMDLGVAWQVFGAYGLLALAVDRLHYGGRYWGVGAALLAAALEIFFWQQGTRTVEAFTWPLAALLLAVGYCRRGTPELRDFLYGIAQLVAYGPSSVQSLRENWGVHGLLLGGVSLLGMLFGVSQKNRCLTVGSVVVLLANALFQSRAWFWSLPSWAYMGLAGAALIGVAGVFEYRREWVSGGKERLVEAWDKWD